MAVHKFICDGCNVYVEDISAEDIHKCPQCGQNMRWDINITTIGNKDYHKAIHSDALGIMPSQVEEHKKLFPGIKLDDQCRPVFDNYQKHEAYLKKTGFVKEPQKIRRAGAVKIDIKTDR